MIYVAVGANLPGRSGGSPRATCEQAIARMAAWPGLRLVRRSPWYSSAPVPHSDQPRYVNGVVALEASPATPEWLLGVLQRIEADAGRVRGARDEARVLDLDIVDMEGVVRDNPDPVLPHPRAHLRGFVLLPLRDIAPEWLHPSLRVPIAALVAALPAQDVTLLSPDER